MLNPGSSSSRYSLTPALFLLLTRFNFTSSQNGSHRAVVPINTWENVLPMDICQMSSEIYYGKTLKKWKILVLLNAMMKILHYALLLVLVKPMLRCNKARLNLPRQRFKYAVAFKIHT